MPRYALLLEYDGTGFVGWQRQDNGLSVQQVLETAAARLTGGIPVAATTAGRTDAGVHARGQVVHIDMPKHFMSKTLREALNFHMKPHRVAVLDAAEVAADWNARFAATGRSYRYTILNRRARPALDAGYVWHVQTPLDAARMHDAAQCLLGRHDFTSFRAAACQAKTPWRTLDRLDVRSEGECVLVIVAARSFLHHMVRNLVGTLKLIGDESWPVAIMPEILAARDRSRAGPTAPAAGLCMTGVRYEVDPFLAGDGRGSAELGGSTRQSGGSSRQNGR